MKAYKTKIKQMKRFYHKDVVIYSRMFLHATHLDSAFKVKSAFSLRSSTIEGCFRLWR